MRKAITTFYLLLFVLMIGCSDNNEFEELSAKKFNTVAVSLKGSQIYYSKNSDVIEGIVNEINTNRKEFSTEMSFSREPEGRIKLTGENEVEVSFFEDTGRSIYGNYYIHTDFKFD